MSESLATEQVHKKLTSFVGNATAIEELRAAIDAKSNTGSFLLYGPEGTGKATLCHHLARLILSDFAIDNQVLEGVMRAKSHPDLMIIDGDDEGGKITIDKIREMKDFTRFKPVTSSYKVVIIDKLDQMQKAPANALLKVLEEPAENTFIFCIADQLGRPVPTIRSRCLKFKFTRLTIDEFAKVTELPARNLEQLYRITRGSVTKAQLLTKEENFVDLICRIPTTFFAKEKDMQIIEQIVEFTASAKAHWYIFGEVMVSAIMQRIQEERDVETLDKQLRFLDDFKEKLQDIDTLNLDKKSFIYSVLC